MTHATTDQLTTDAVLAAARAETGLDDIGDERFLEPLTKWLDAINAEAPLAPHGIAALRQVAVGNLATRLRVQNELNLHPEILDEDVSDPIVIVGLPRTGTTKMQRTISRDAGVQKMPFWRILNPVPLPGTGPEDGSDPRIAIAEGFISELQTNFPEFYAAHPAVATEPDEELFMLEIDTQLSISRAQVPTYRDWWLERAPEHRDHLYTYLRHVMQYLQWQDGGKQGRPWVLKSPIHLGALESLLTAFPGATVVHCHRDPTVAVGSTARIVELMRRLCTDDVDLDMLGQDTLNLYATEMNRNLAGRERLGGRLPIVDARYDDIRTDVLAVIREVWKLRGRVLTPEEEAHMAGWEDENPQHRFGKHTYSLERFGLTTDQVEEAFAPYLRVFGPSC